MKNERYTKKNNLYNKFCDLCKKFVDWVREIKFLKNINQFTVKIDLGGTIVSVFVIFLLLAIYIVFMLNINKEYETINFFSNILFVLPITMFISIILLILLSYVINNISENTVFSILYLLVFILLVISFIPLCIMLLPVILIINFLQYQDTDNKLFYYLKRFIKAIISWLLVIVVFIGNIIKGLEMNSEVNAQIMFLVFIIVYICIPIFTSDILRLYENKKEAYKDQSIVLLIVIILLNMFCFMAKINIGQDIEKMLNIISWIFALVSMITMKI